MTDIVHQITVRAPADKVVAALTTQDGLKSWWTVDTEAEGKPGGAARFSFYNRAVTFEMKFDKIDGSHVALSCHDGPPGWAGTALAFDLSRDEMQGGTLVQFRHSAFKDMGGEYAMINTTWGRLMGTLKDYAETGKADPLFKA